MESRPSVPTFDQDTMSYLKSLMTATLQAKDSGAPLKSTRRKALIVN